MCTALQILAINKRIQAQNNAPREFPYFVREGYNVRVLADQYVMDKDGLIYKASQLAASTLQLCTPVSPAQPSQHRCATVWKLQDYDVGTGPSPLDGQEVQFHYTAYNESGGRIDSSFNKGGGKPSVVRLGINGLIPGAVHAATLGKWLKPSTAWVLLISGLFLCASSEEQCPAGWLAGSSGDQV